MKEHFIARVAYVFQDNVNTDVIQPPRFFSLDREKNKEGLFKGVTDPNFPEIREGDIIVAGKNFGCGSSRETVVYALLDNGISAIIAESFGRIFYRNCINNGLLAITLDDTSMIKRDDKLEIDIRTNKIKVNDYTETFFYISDFIKQLLSTGGLLKKLENEL